LSTENQIAHQKRLKEEHKDMLVLPPLMLRRFGDLSLRYIYRDDFLLTNAADKSVLHIGCSSAPYTEQRLQAGTHLHERLLGVTRELYGIDLSSEGLDIMSSYLKCGNLFVGDAERLEEVSITKNDFDIVLAGDILEHLNNPGLFLAGVQRFMGPQSRLIISTNNAFSLPNFVRLVLGGFREGTGHVFVNSPATLTNLLDRHGMKATEIATGYERKPTGSVRRATFQIGATAFKLFPALGGTLIVVAMLNSSKA
jgi:2-polyprenyl-3-methyl-5-hydroxy-6-metoxy-1,4-benzoquinol methylase